MKETSFMEYLDKNLKEPEFREAWEDLEEEFALKEALYRARKVRGLTQKKISDITGIPQAEISRLENGKKRPTLKQIRKIANVSGSSVKIEIVPKDNC